MKKKPWQSYQKEHGINTWITNDETRTNAGAGFEDDCGYKCFMPESFGTIEAWVCARLLILRFFLFFRQGNGKEFIQKYIPLRMFLLTISHK